ncbi:Uncharacterized conserved protein YndB, AHSA1/START domain [Actinokineospora alba]|uniref:Uncharacterized conserved protein YndB, AHSA1/START domain n=1 Tax=Actinokineospora alba TaxID=504798 RepID=A0A1H0WED5_9PSEU|nr:SRPBCC family protein [Actinokineospora alba]TDP68912.1 uncharacterized protein YndB with AHSA1/START domain [Actinokineospora alba]SDI75052.1 Uncharacterized conserved protein YndB, AHSA1/START domain [Actinokineospora alba]SDP89027.1 Uncharacterized conserved protein YndB, AHSA1/START domain [Actinokineospora alba]
MSVTHATFVVERVYPATPERVFNAWADPEFKARWFAGPDDWENSPLSLDFRVGGEESSSGGPKGGPVHTMRGRYQDIVPNERIVSSYEMYMDDQRISVSLATVELTPKGDGTLLTYTEQGAFLDGLDQPKYREEGTAELLDALGAALSSENATA